MNAISDTLGDRCGDFADLIEVYRAPSEGEARYSPAEVASVEVVPVVGKPRSESICTSIVEHQNLTIRRQMRRPTRLTHGFSKKWENLGPPTPSVRLLQLLADSQHDPRYSGHGSGHYGSCLGLG